MRETRIGKAGWLWFSAAPPRCVVVAMVLCAMVVVSTLAACGSTGVRGAPLPRPLQCSGQGVMTYVNAAGARGESGDILELARRNFRDLIKDGDRLVEVTRPDSGFRRVMMLRGGRAVAEETFRMNRQGGLLPDTRIACSSIAGYDISGG
jgi:hypothetical protein